MADETASVSPSNFIATVIAVDVTGRVSVHLLPLPV
jgi:hypothetical protein